MKQNEVGRAARDRHRTGRGRHNSILDRGLQHAYRKVTSETTGT
jgi:hypothetical protein